MYCAQYRCLYREHWYDDEDSGWTASFREAERRAGELQRSGRQARVIAEDGRMWNVPQPHRPLVLVRRSERR